MRIDENNNMNGIGASGVGKAQAADNAQAHKARAGRGSAAKGPDEVALSVLAERLQALEPGSADQDQKLKVLQAAYESGRYQPDSEAVADALLDESLSETRQTKALD